MAFSLYINIYENIYIFININIRWYAVRMICMIAKGIKIWIWVHNNRILKAISNQDAGTLTIYDDCDNIVLKRTGLSRQQIKTIELIFSAYNLKKIDDHNEPFTYL